MVRRWIVCGGIALGGALAVLSHRGAAPAPPAPRVAEALAPPSDPPAPAQAPAPPSPRGGPNVQVPAALPAPTAAPLERLRAVLEGDDDVAKIDTIEGLAASGATARSRGCSRSISRGSPRPPRR